MPKIALPYLSSSLREIGRTGKLKFGWCETVVDIEECDPVEFRLATTTVFNSEHSRSTYERGGLFWGSAIAPVLNTLINLGGVNEERRFGGNGADNTAWWLQALASDVLENRLNGRAADAGMRLARDFSERIKIVSRLRPGDGHDSDREAFAAWAADNLLWSNGRLLRRLHSPSSCISWNHSQFLDNRCTPTKILDDGQVYGSSKPLHGIHFRLGDPGFEEMWTQAERDFGVAINYSQLAYNRHYAPAIKTALGQLAERHHIVIQDNVVFDRQVLEDVSEEGWEDMGMRSAVSLAKAIAATASPHLHAPGPLRTALEEIKRLFAITFHDRPDDFPDRLEAVLSSLPTEGNRTREWFVGKVLDRWSDRSISLSPKLYGM
jgi:hypothetical protein